ncbi:MAG: aromatic amino acid transport family protein [Chlamydiota bacterium]
MNRFLGAILLVAGTTIGAGMLGLPMITAFCGFYPSIVTITICWLFLLLSSFLMLDVNLSIEGEVNLISMAEKTLGKWGKVACWISYLFLLYALDVAYLAGGSKILQEFIPWPTWVLSLIILIPLALITYSGMKNVDGINRLMMAGKLGVGYILLIIFVPSHIKYSNLVHVDLNPILLSLPIILQAFGFHTVISSLVPYLHRNVVKLRWSLTLGSFLALIVYIIWELLVLGVVPVIGDISISKAWMQGEVSTAPLIHILHQPMISTGAFIFAIFAIGTAFLGVSIGLFDFLIDGFKLKRDVKGKALAFTAAFLPPFIFVITCPRIFLSALEYAGVMVAVIFGLIPICMAWTLPKTSFWGRPNGKMVLVTAALFFGGVVVLDVLSKTSVLESILAVYLR